MHSANLCSCFIYCTDRWTVRLVFTDNGRNIGYSVRLHSVFDLDDNFTLHRVYDLF